jgi:signal transduction histidine kinase/ligand-binding sensor domain-containing protein
MKKLLACSLFFGFAFSLYAQNPFARYKVEKIDAHQGLTTDFIFNSFQARDGYLWMSSYSGYIRYDGKKFETFNSKNTPQIKADNSNGLFTETTDSTMWFPTASSGLLSFKNGVFKTYLDGSTNLYYRGRTAKGELLISESGADTSSSLIIFNPTTHQYKKVPQNEFLNYWASRGNLKDTSLVRWTVRNGVIHYNDPSRGLLAFGANMGITEDMSFANFFRDSKNRTWITTEFGLYSWNGLTIVPYPGMKWARIIQSNPSFGHIAEDRKGGIWLSTGNGLAYLPAGEDQFYIFPPTNLKIQTLTNINIDREDNIWLATDRGLFKISPTNLINYAEAEGIENNRVSAISQTGENKFLVIGTNSKLYRLEEGVIKPYPLRQKNLFGQTRNILYVLKGKDGTQWICTEGNIFKLSGQDEKQIPVNGQVRYACEGIDGRIYFAVAFQGIGFINDSGQFEYVKFPGMDFRDVYISNLFQRSDGTWVVSTYRTGIYFLFPNGKVERQELFDSTKGIQAFDMYQENDQTLWVASGKGLVRIRGNKKQSIGAEAGLTELSLFKILADRNGYWWLPSNIGIIRVKKAELDAYLDNPATTKINWRIFDEGDGMYNRQCVGARHSIVASDGRIMVLSIGGLVEIDPKKITRNNIPPQLSIRQLLVDDEVYPLGIGHKIPPGNHRYIFDYSVLSFTAPEKNSIKFRLIGYDKDWIVSKGEQRAFYTGLEPGEYRFEVLGSNNDGVWATLPAVYVFEVEPMYYQTMWFKGLIVLAFLAGIWALIRWRTKATRAANLKLEQQVAQRTSELQSSLDKLTSTQKQLIQSEKMASLGELTAGIAHEIQNPLNFVNNFSDLSNELIEEMKAAFKNGEPEEGFAIADDIKQNLEKINHHGKRADAIVKGMLQHSSSGSGKKEPTDINALADEYLRLAYHGLRAKDKNFNATIKTEFDESIGSINIIPQDIGRVLLNLINNAFYAVNERSKEQVIGYEPTVSISTRKVNGELKICVADNGNGIPEKVLDKVFQPFFTTKPTGQGTGLGLSLSYDIIKAHQGKINIRNTPGAGAEFIITLPINA